MAVPQVNGDVASPAHYSAFLEHILNYPVINDSVKTVKGNEYAQRSFQLGDSAYQTFAAPVLPYLSRPYQFVSPYVERADALGDKTLNAIDARFPIVKKPTAELYNDTKSIVFFPYNKGVEGRDHVFEIYNAEAKKQEQQGIVGQGKAAVATALVVSNEALGLVSTFLTTKKAEAAQATKEKISQ